MVNLSGVGATKEVVLSFNWVSEADAGESLAVDVRDSFSNWVQVATLSNSDGHQPLPATITVQLAPNQISANSGVRFRPTDNDWGSSDQFVIDDVKLTVGDIQSNPNLAPSCGLDVMLVLDESGSINSAGATAQVESAVTAFAAGLNNTTSRLRIAEFSTNARLASIGGNTGYRQVNGNPDPAINTYLTTGGNAELATNYNPGTGQQYTNWEAGLSVAANNLATGKLVVFVTDGQPNTVGTAGNSGDNNGPGEGAASAGAAIDELESIKAAGAHVLAVGVGDASNDANFDLLTRTVEPNNAQVWQESDGGLPDLRTVDSIRVSSFGALENALRRVVFALCSPSVTITKVDDAGTPIAGWNFTGEVDVAPQNGGTDQYEWMVPSLGITADNGSGNDGGAGSAAARTRTTNASGQALFQWAPNTVSDPQPWLSTFRYTETLPVGWTLGAQQQACTVQRLNDDGTVTNTTNSPTSSVNGQNVTFTLTGVQKGDIVSCTVKNNRPAQITITKAIAPGPSSPDDFSFTGGLGSFALDVDSDATLPSTRTFALPAGNYTVTETDPAASYWKLTSLQCGSVTGSASGTPNLGARSAAITVAAGSAITCTYTNTKVPAPALNVVKTASIPSFPEKAGTVTYTVQVSNPNGTANPILITDEDDLVVLEGAPGVPVELNTPTLPLAYPGGQITANTCDDLDGQTVTTSPLSCTFTVAFSNRNSGDTIDDNVTVKGTDTFGNPVQGSDPATVEVTNVAPQISVVKSNKEPVAVVAPGGLATYTVSVTNPAGAVENLILTGVTDVLQKNGGAFGSVDLTTDSAPFTNNTCNDAGNVLVGTVLMPGQTYNCEFTVDTTLIGSLAQDDVLSNLVTVSGRDDDPTPQTVQGSDDATRTILGEPPKLVVFKTDNNAQIVEPDDDIVYSITITNASTTESVTVTKIVDSVNYNGAPVGTLTIQDNPPGDPVEVSFVPAGAGTASYVSTTCASATDGDGGIGSVLAANNGATTCTFTLNLAGDGGDGYDDKVVVDGIDQSGDAVSAENTADTPVINAVPVIDITKTPSPTSVPETGGAVTFTLQITNNSVSTDPLTLTTLTDTIFGDLFDAGNAAVSANTCAANESTVLQPGSSTTCTFSASLKGNVGVPHRNTVTVQATDDEGTQAQDDASADVTFTDVLPVIDVTKTANLSSVPESGGSVVYTIQVVNKSAEPVTISSLSDNKFDLTAAPTTCGAAIGTVLAPYDGSPGGADTYSCQITRTIAQVGSETNHTNVATAVAKDDEQNPATDSDDETVTFTLIPPTVDITKTDKDASVEEPGGDVTYHITISNSSFEPVTITSLTDTITYADPASVVGPFNVLATGPNVVATTCGDDVSLAANDNAPGGGDEVTCQFTVHLTGTAQIVKDRVNVSVVDNDQEPGSDFADDTTPITDRPVAVSITKTASPTVIAEGDSTVYTFVITNLATWEPLYVTSLVDDKFGDLSGVGTCAVVSEQAPLTIAAGGQYTCSAELTPNFAAQPVQGEHTNVVTVEGFDDEGLETLGGENEAEPVTDSDTETVYASADIGMTKSVVGAATLDPATGEWTIVYDLVVRNDGGGGGSYDIDDELGFGAGVVVQSVDVSVLSVTGQVDPAGPVTGDINPAFDGDSDTTLISGVEIVGHATHTYRVSVTATIDEPVVGAGACHEQTGENGGFLNTATLTANGEAQGPDRACDDFSTLRLVKHVDNGDGGDASPSDFHLTATPVDGDDAVVSGDGDVTAAVPAGSYDLAESPLAGYVPGTWSCGVIDSADGMTTGNNVDVAAASDVVCEITNDDQPVDLALTKDDGGVVAQAGGAAFPYTITVQNIGGRDADSDEPVVVTDVLPGAFEWVSFPDDALESPVCSQAGQVLTCSIDPAALTADGATVEIVATVRALPSTSAGTYTNKAWVTTHDDPVCPAQQQEALTFAAEVDAAPCLPPCPDGESSNNVDCEDTPVDNTATIVVDKVDNVADGVDVEPGQSFGYAITVQNMGPQPVDHVRITDAIPSALVLVSASGTNWNCSATAGSNVDCTYGAQLAAGASSAPLDVSVTLKASFVGDNIHNVAIGTADVVKPEGPFKDERVTDQDDEDTPARSLDISLLTSDCVKDAPFVNYSINPVGFTPVPGATATVTIYRLGTNTVIETITGLPLSGRFLYSGAAVDAEGNGTDWPGWKLENGEWVLDETDAFLRDGIRVVVSVNPTAEATVAYPPASSACASPQSTAADMAIVKTASVAQVGAGGGFSWILSVKNNGPDPAFGVVVGDIVPSSLQVTSVQSGDFNCSANGNAVSCTRTTMAVGETGTVTINVAVPASAPDGTIQNIGTVQSDLPDPDLTNNSDDASVVVVAQQAPTTTLPPVVLPPTGSNSTIRGLQLAAIAVLLGGFALLVTRRRRQEP